MRTLATSLIVLGVAFLPRLLFAAPRTFGELVDLLIAIIDTATPALIAAAFVLFLYNIFGSFGFLDKDGGKAVSKEKFRSAAGWGIIILFVMVSIWGILQLLRNTFFNTNGFTAPGSGEQIDCAQFDNC